MKRSIISLIVLVFLLGTVVPITHTSAQLDNPWADVVPRASFGYGGLLSVYWSPLNGQLAAASETGFQFYNADMELEGERRFDEPINGAVLFSLDMNYVAIQEYNGLVIHNTRTWEPVLALGQYGGPSWSHDSRLLAVWAGDRLRIWDVENAEVTLEVDQLISNQTPVQWSPDSQVVAVAGPGAIVMLRTDTGDIVRIHAFDTIRDFDWSADGRWFGIIGRKDPLPPDFDPDDPIVYELMRIDAVTGDIVAHYDMSSGGIEGTLHGTDSFVAISPNGRFVAAKLTRWDPRTEERREGWLNPGMGIWELDSGRKLHDFSNFNRPLASVNSLSWSPDGSNFATTANSTLTVFGAESGQVVDSLRAYISSTSQTEWTNDGNRLIAAGGLWDVSGPLPRYSRVAGTPPQPQRVNLDFLRPDPAVFDYDRPPYRWHVVQVYEDRGLVITYEQDIEYPDTPEYDDDIAPDERWIIWNIATEERWEQHINLGKQTAWLYDLENADERANGNTYYNVIRTTRFIVIGDDEIMDLRDEDEVKIPLEVNRYEWREVWFSPDGARIYAYDTDNRFKAFDPMTGALLYETVPAPRDNMIFSDDLTHFILIDSTATIFVYDSVTGELLLEAYTGNSYPRILWSDDMQRIAIGGDNNAIIIYDVPTQTRLAVLRGHQNAITSMDWHSTCDYSDIRSCKYVFASSDADGRVILWGVPDGTEFVQEIVAYPSEPSLDLPLADIDFSTLDPLWTYVAQGDVYGRSTAETVRWTDQGIAVNGRFLYDTNLNLTDDRVQGIDWIRPNDRSTDGYMVMSDGTVLDPAGGQMGHVGRDSVYDAIFTPDGTRILTAENASGHTQLTGRIREWSLTSGQQLSHWGGGSPGYNQIELSPDNRILATATMDYFGSGGRVQLWDFASRELIISLIGHTDTITFLKWHPTLGTIITASRDGSLRLWNTDSEELARWRHPANAPIHSVQWGVAPNTLIVSAGDDLVVIDTRRLDQLRMIEGIGGRDFAWSPDYDQIVSIGSDSVVRVLDYASGEIMAEERRHMPSITDIEWHPDGTTLAVARRDGSLVLLDGQTGEVIRILRSNGLPIRSLFWNPSGTRLLLDLEEGPIEIIDGQSGAISVQIDNQWRRRGAWWSPDGQQVAFGTFPDPEMGVYTATSLVWVYDANTGQPIHQLSLDWDDYSWYWDVKPCALSWSPDNSYLAAFYGGRLRLWNLARDGEVMSTYYDINRQLSLAIWGNRVLYFWTPTGHGQLDLNSRELSYIEQGGLPAGTSLRGDGQVLLSGERILDFNTFYPLQDISRGFADAAWHPSCWSSGCPSILAVAYGSNVTLFGYVEGE